MKACHWLVIFVEYRTRIHFPAARMTFMVFDSRRDLA